ncbi:hypothetical protein [Carboxylicivirga linearis]|uniref:Transposase n=1 Tax=Carboxylicivirga linearis TaxID=1628157 RepID=A0ABS5JTF8_9BACT|nr:hypothetical protein [Carboxylicivirga linearis]MBS2097646.1 hypothetical protein [Carboxylicivirga linearis]
MKQLEWCFVETLILLNRTFIATFQWFSEDQSWKSLNKWRACVGIDV